MMPKRRTQSNDAPDKEVARRGPRGVEPLHPSAAVWSDPIFWVVSTLLVAATLAAYYPALNADLVRWDDDVYILKNPSLKMDGAEGLRKIWTWDDADNPQFYPLVFTTFALEYKLANMKKDGLKPHVFHKTSTILQVINAILLLAVLRRIGLSMPVAALAAMLFAVHPAQVASVAWVTERKNTLSGMFYLICILLYLWHRRIENPMSVGLKWSLYAASIFVFVLAMLSKTQVLSLPLTLLMLEPVIQTARRVTRRGLLLCGAALAPMVAIGMGFGMLTAHLEQKNGASRNPEKISTPAERVPIATTAAWFYAKTFVAPFDLSPVYPRWQVDAASLLWWMPLVGWIVAMAAALFVRRWIGGLILWGLAHFFVVLGPAMGLRPFNYQQYSFVADHYLYLSCIGGGVVVAVIWARLLRVSVFESQVPTEAAAMTTGVPLRQALKRSAREAGGAATSESPSESDTGAADRLLGLSRSAIFVAVAAFLSVGCAAMSNHESRYWLNNEVFLRRGIEKNPTCWPFLYNLGNEITRQRLPTNASDAERAAFEQKRLEAVDLYRRATEAYPASTQFYSTYINALVASESRQAAIERCTRDIAADPQNFKPYWMRAKLLPPEQKSQIMADYQKVLQLPAPKSINDQARAQLARLRRE